MIVLKLNIPKGVFLKIYVAQMVIICFAVVITLVSSYLCSVSRLENELEKTNISFINQIHDNIEMQLYNIDRQTLNFMDEANTINFLENRYADNAMRQRTNEEVQNRLNTLKYINSNISEIYLYSNVSKRIITGDSVRLVDEADNSSRWMEYIADKSASHIWYISDDNENEQVVLVRPYISSSAIGDIRGAMIVTVRADVLFASMLNNVNISRDTGIYFIDGVGGRYSINSDRLLDEKIFEKIISSEQYSAWGKTFFHRSSDYTNWHYISEISSNNGDGISFLLAIVLIGIIIIVISFIFTRISNVYTIQPIDNLLRELTDNFAATQNSENSYSDEMEKLKAVFNNIITERRSMQTQIKEALPAIKWRILSEIAQGSIGDYEELIPYFEMVGIRLGNSNYIAAVAEIDNEEYINKSIINELSEHIEEIINQDEVNGSVFVSGCSSLGIIMTFTDSNEDAILLNSFAICELIRENVKKLYEFTVSIGIGSLYKDMSEARISYSEAERALKYKIVTGTDSIIAYQDINGVQNINISGYFNSIEKIVSVFVGNDRIGVESRLGGFFADIREQKIQPEMMRQLAVQIIIDCIKSTSIKSPDTKKLDEIGFYNIYYKIMELNDASRILESVKQALFMLMDLKESNAKKIKEGHSNAAIVEKINTYINEHYMDNDLSLNKIADEFDLSDAHVSRIFKANMGIGLMSYIIKTRISKAEEMLVGTDYKISRIAEELGYSHTSFLRIFKQYTGYMPSEYRNMNKSEK